MQVAATAARRGFPVAQYLAAETGDEELILRAIVQRAETDHGRAQDEHAERLAQLIGREVGKALGG